MSTPGQLTVHGFSGALMSMQKQASRKVSNYKELRTAILEAKYAGCTGISAGGTNDIKGLPISGDYGIDDALRKLAALMGWQVERLISATEAGSELYLEIDWGGRKLSVDINDEEIHMVGPSFYVTTTPESLNSIDLKKGRRPAEASSKGAPAIIVRGFSGTGITDPVVVSNYRELSMAVEWARSLKCSGVQNMTPFDPSAPREAYGIDDALRGISKAMRWCLAGS